LLLAEITRAMAAEINPFEQGLISHSDLHGDTTQNHLFHGNHDAWVGAIDVEAHAPSGEDGNAQAGPGGARGSVRSSIASEWGHQEETMQGLGMWTAALISDQCSLCNSPCTQSYTTCQGGCCGGQRLCVGCDTALHRGAAACHPRYTHHLGDMQPVSRVVAFDAGLFRCNCGTFPLAPGHDPNTLYFVGGSVLGPFGCIAAKFGRLPCLKCGTVARVVPSVYGFVSPPGHSTFAVDWQTVQFWMSNNRRTAQVSAYGHAMAAVHQAKNAGFSDQLKVPKSKLAALYTFALGMDTVQRVALSRSEIFDGLAVERLHPSVVANARQRDRTAACAPVRCVGCELATSTTKAVDGCQKLAVATSKAELGFTHVTSSAPLAVYAVPAVQVASLRSTSRELSDDSNCTSDLSVKNKQNAVGGDLFKGILTAVCGHGAVAGVSEMKSNEAYSMVALFLDCVLTDFDCTVGYDSACQLIPMLSKCRDMLLRGESTGVSLQLIDKLLAKTLVVDNLHAAGHVEPCAQLYGAFGADGGALGRFEANETLNAFLGKAAPRLRQMNVRRRTVELSHLLVAWSVKANDNIVANTYATIQRASKMAIAGACELFSQGAPSLPVLREWGDLLVRRARTAYSSASQRAARKRSRSHPVDAAVMLEACVGSVGQALGTPDRASAEQDGVVSLASYFGEDLVPVRRMLVLLREAHSLFLKAVSLHVYIGGSESGERLNITSYQDARVKFSQVSTEIIARVMDAVSLVSDSGLAIQGSPSVRKHWRRALLFLSCPLTSATVVALCRAYATGRINTSVTTSIAAQERRAALLSQGVASGILPWLPMLQLADSLETHVDLEVDSPGPNACWEANRYKPWEYVFREVASDLWGVPLHVWPSLLQKLGTACMCAAIIDIGLRCGLHPVWLPMLRWATQTKQLQEAAISCGQSTLLREILEVAEGWSLGRIHSHSRLQIWLLQQTPDCYHGSSVYSSQSLVADSAAMVESLARIFRASEQFIHARETLASARSVTSCAQTSQGEALLQLAETSRRLQQDALPGDTHQRGFTAFLQQLVSGHKESSKALLSSTHSALASWATFGAQGSDSGVRLTDWVEMCMQHAAPIQFAAPAADNQ